MNMKKKAFIGVYGCQMNISDAERMEGQLVTIGYERTENMEAADLILLNTCCVRETAEDKVYGKIGEIKHLKREKPSLIFGITGCMAQKEGDALIKRAPHIDFVLGTNKVHELTHVIQEVEAAKGGHVVDVLLGDTELPDDVPVQRGGRLSMTARYSANSLSPPASRQSASMEGKQKTPCSAPFSAVRNSWGIKRRRLPSSCFS